MTMYEILKLNKGLFEFMASNDIQPQDVQYLAMYEEYLRMKKEGYKTVYIVAFLSDKYRVCEATVYRVVKRFKICLYE